METDGDDARIREFSQSLWRILKWTQETVRIPSATPAFELLVALGTSLQSELSYDDLEAMTGRSHRAMQYVVHDLRAMGLIEVRNGSEDRRRRIIRLSPAGLRLYCEFRDRALGEISALATSPPPLMPASKSNGLGKPAGH